MLEANFKPVFPVALKKELLDYNLAKLADSFEYDDGAAAAGVGLTFPDAEEVKDEARLREIVAETKGRTAFDMSGERMFFACDGGS